MGTLIDRTGQRLGLLTVKSRAANNEAGYAQWNCVCDCGTEVVLSSHSLSEYGAYSCGCAQPPPKPLRGPVTRQIIEDVHRRLLNREKWADIARIHGISQKYLRKVCRKAFPTLDDPSVEWRPIPDCEGYSINRLGHVRNAKRLKLAKWRWFTRTLSVQVTVGGLKFTLSVCQLLKEVWGVKATWQELIKSPPPGQQMSPPKTEVLRVKNEEAYANVVNDAKFIADYRSHIKVDPESGCHIWTGARTECGSGYGEKGVRHDGNLLIFDVHRLALFYRTGKSPIGQHALHNPPCRNKACCNPDHLRWGTREENAADEVGRPQQQDLSLDQVREIRSLLIQGETVREIFVRTGVSVPRIRAISDGRTYEKVDAARRQIVLAIRAAIRDPATTIKLVEEWETCPDNPRWQKLESLWTSVSQSNLVARFESGGD